MRIAASSGRVLVVEDEMLVLMMTEDLLADLGYEDVQTASTNARALSLIAERPFDAAMLDLNLNGDRSYPVADALAGRGVPFFFVTGYTSAAIREDLRQRPLLQKPIEPAKLAAMLREVLG